MNITKKSRVFDATADTGNDTGLTLYQEWITHKAALFDELTTTIHADWANRQLRNAFRKHFKIDAVWFGPDQINKAYTSQRQDRWLVIADWKPVTTSTGPPRTSKIYACEWVVLTGEEFEISTDKKRVHGFGRQPDC